ncbi:hypothetical protein CJF32_00000225 [Rutstroemia sp. NJR-2017a WRK4]|nr:hypothetical protein CJF32_00000225 [Rutstroemia sp. NJR-2017a WRK4]
MLNLDLLFWASVELRSPHLYNIAKTHAQSTQTHLIRPNSSTFHVVNFDQATGTVKAKFTNQGYSDSSSWSRGQAWAIVGFAQTYGWTGDRSFLDTASSCADYFLKRLEESGSRVPPWDFDAPSEDGKRPTDTSAAMMGDGEDTILKGATINNYEFAPRRWADHGLVYADYYFLMVGNLLLEMGIGENFIKK